MSKKFIFSGIIAVMALAFIIIACSDKVKSPVEVTGLTKDAQAGIQCEPVEPPTTECPPVAYDLWAGMDILVGNVTVWNDAENLYVQYNTDAPWYLTEVHLYIQTEPFTSRLAPGRAPYKSGDISYASTYTFTIPLQWECDVTIYLQAHAAVVKIVDGEVVDEETAYGGDITKPGRGAWYGNIAYTICCAPPPPPKCQYETAWGGNSEGSGAAWWFYYDVSVGGVQTIWAGQHINVGTVKVEDGCVYINLTGGWELSDIDIDGKLVTESVKIQGYDSIPDTRPAAGKFTTYKGNDLTVCEIGGFAFYAIHLDVQLCKQEAVCKKPPACFYR